jgi:predicted dehydrogenase
MGTHILDVTRYLFGEADSVYCRIERVNPDIKGEDVATVVLGMSDGATIVCDLSYASRTERERFPETFIFVEGSEGSLELGTDYWIRVTTAGGTHAKRYPPPRYDWADPAYDLVHSSIVPCQENLLAGLRGTGVPETTAEDNLKTLRLVFAAYESAESESVVRVSRR